MVQKWDIVNNEINNCYNIQNLNDHLYGKCQKDMAVILPIDNVACQFEVLDGHVVHVTEQPLEIVHHVKLSVGRIRSHVHNRSGIIHIFIFDLVVRDHLGVLVALDANIARVILVLMFFEDFE